MYTQLKELYSLEEHLKHIQKSHISIYITPNGKIFDCRQNGIIDHIKFTEYFYKNYKELINIHNDINFDTEVSEFILDDENFSLKDIRDFYLDQFDYLQYSNPELYHLVKHDYLAVDNLLVQDLGFVKVSINRGELPVVDLPVSIFNNKSLTPEQYNVLVKVLENNTVSYQDYDIKRLIKLREQDVKRRTIQLNELKEKSLYNK